MLAARSGVKGVVPRPLNMDRYRNPNTPMPANERRRSSATNVWYRSTRSSSALYLSSSKSPNAKIGSLNGSGIFIAIDLLEQWSDSHIGSSLIQDCLSHRALVD